MTEKIDELEPCPFCGDYGAEVQDSALITIGGTRKKAVYCNTCFSEGPAHETVADAVEAWNNRSAAHGESKVPQFIVRDAERAIDAATNQKGMHTNGPAMARIEASRLAALLRYAQMNSAAPAQAGSAEPLKWRFTGIGGLKRYLTDKQYQAQTHGVKKFYVPICDRCVITDDQAGSAESEREAFEKWANTSGYDVAYTYDTERSRHIWLNPMTADLWAAWQARAALSAQGQQSEDASLLDWLEAHPGFQLEKFITWRNGEDEYDGIERSYWQLTTNDDDEFKDSTLRGAIRAAMSTPSEKEQG